MQLTRRLTLQNAVPRNAVLTFLQAIASATVSLTSPSQQSLQSESQRASCHLQPFQISLPPPPTHTPRKYPRTESRGSSDTAWESGPLSAFEQREHMKLRN
jgi:hypothetical protein